MGWVVHDTGVGVEGKEENEQVKWVGWESEWGGCDCFRGKK